MKMILYNNFHHWRYSLPKHYVSQPKLWLPLTLKDYSRQEHTLSSSLDTWENSATPLPVPATEPESSINSVNIERGAPFSYTVHTNVDVLHKRNSTILPSTRRQENFNTWR